MSRLGNFTSSEIWKLTTLATNKKDFGKPALTYIQEKRYELNLGRRLNSESNSKPTDWGNICEKLAYDTIEDFEYSLVSKIRFEHQTISNWNGCPDLVKSNYVGDIKCPYTLKSFCQLIDCFSDINLLKKEYPEYYWQLVSNAILTNSSICELYVFVPYKEQLSTIKQIANANNVANWLNYASDESLPYLIKGQSNYVNLNKFMFEVDKLDIEFLEEKVSKAVKLLLQ